MPFVGGSASLCPPAPMSLTLGGSVFRLLLSTCLRCVLGGSPTGETTSSPPTPPLVSAVAFLSSLKSLNGGGVLDSSSGNSAVSSVSSGSVLTGSLGSSSSSSYGVSFRSTVLYGAFICSLCFVAVNSGSTYSFVCFYRIF